LPFTKYVLTADYTHPLSHHKKNISYSGYHETAYLHPNQFTPNLEPLKALGLSEGDPFVILRFVSWNATHDIGHKGISMEMKRKAIQEFSKYAKVFISSESLLPEEFRQYQLKVKPQDLHHLLYYASLVWAESFTIPAECSVLGTPSIIMHNTTSLYLKEQEEKYHLCFNFSESLEDQEKAIAKGMEILSKPDGKQEWRVRREELLKDKVDLSAYLVWFFTHYPESAKGKITFQS
jgi:predicted glycosyltransferase